MSIPFTVDQFFGVFAQYNAAIWPLQVVAYLLAGVALALVFVRQRHAGRVMSAVLALFWVWMGAVYHIAHFRQINPAALAFGILFVVQGVLFLAYGVLQNRLPLAYASRPLPMVGLFFILFAMVCYPLLGVAFGHRYPAAPLFGVAPCPTTIFTFGVLLWSASRVPAPLLPIPFLWSLLGVSAAAGLGVRQDYGLAVAGVLGTALVLLQNRRRRLPAPAEVP